MPIPGITSPLHVIQQHAPERYLDNLRETIPQQWETDCPSLRSCHGALTINGVAILESHETILD